MKFRKKPIVIEAWQYRGGDIPLSAPHFILRAAHNAYSPEGKVDSLSIDTLEGRMRADPGDWIIQGVKGEVYPCKPDIFAATYEPSEISEDKNV